MGVTLGVATFQAAWSWIVGIILLALTIAITVVLTRSFAKRRDIPGEGLTDRRSTLIFMAMYLAVFALGQARVPHAWQPWWALAVAVIALSGGLGYLRLTERSTIDRLAGSTAPTLMRDCPESFQSPTRVSRDSRNCPGAVVRPARVSIPSVLWQAAVGVPSMDSRTARAGSWLMAAPPVRGSLRPRLRLLQPLHHPHECICHVVVRR